MLLYTSADTGLPPSVTVPKRLRISTFDTCAPVPEMSMPNEPVSSAEIAGHVMPFGEGLGTADGLAGSATAVGGLAHAATISRSVRAAALTGASVWIPLAWLRDPLDHCDDGTAGHHHAHAAVASVGYVKLPTIVKRDFLGIVELGSCSATP